MAERSVVLKLKADIGDLKGKLSEVEKSIDSVTQKQKQTADAATFSSEKMADAAMDGAEAYDAIAGALLVVGGAAAAGFGLAVKASMAYEEELSGIQAATGATSDVMDKLAEAALKAGADTQYSATEAADAVTQLAKAGVSTADILSGGLAGALNLAAAGQMDVGEAAELAATAMNQFGLEGRDVEHIADLLAAGAGNAQGEVSDLGMALSQAGLVANQTGLTIEETTAGLTAFAAAGLVGSDAGTSMKSMLQRLTPQSKEAEKEMTRLGISAYDAQGEFIGLSEFAGNLKESMRDLTPEQRNASMAIIFGSDAVRAANVLYEEGAAGIESWESKVDDAGYAARQAAAKTDNLTGDLERLGGAWETAMIRTGTGADGPLRGIVQRLDFVVSAYANAGDGAQTAARWIAGTTAVVGLAGGAAMLAAPKIVAFETALAAMGPAGAKASAGLVAARTALIGPFGIALGIATVAVGFWANEQYKAAQYVDQMSDTLDRQTGAFTDSTREMVKNDLAMKDGWWDDESAFDSAERLGISLADVTDGAMGNVEAYDRVSVALDTLEEGHVRAVRGGDQMTNSIANIRAAMDGNIKSLGKAGDATQQKIDADASLVQAEDGVEDAVAATTVVVDEQAEAITKWIEELQGIATAFVEPLDVYTTLLDEKTEAEKAAAEATAQTQNDSIDSQIEALRKRGDAESLAVTVSGEEATKQQGIIRDRRDAEVKALGEQKTSWKDYSEEVSDDAKATADAQNESIDSQIAALEGRSDAEIDAVAISGSEATKQRQIVQDRRDAEIEALEAQKTSWEDYVGDVTVSVGEYAAALEQQVADQLAWETNVIEITRRGGIEVGQLFFDMGRNGADQTAAMADAGEEDFERLKTAMIEESRLGSTGAAQELGNGMRVMDALGRAGAKATAKSIAEELGLGVEEVQGIAAQYGLTLASGIDPILTALGKATVRAQLHAGDGRTYSGFADGGIEDHTAQIAHAGAWRLWAEPETPGPAFNPRNPTTRRPSRRIYLEAHS